jgi:hypothetical protein
MRDAFATVELIQPFLDCRKKFDLLSDFLQGNFIGQLANRIQDNFFLTHVNEYVRPLKQANWKISDNPHAAISAADLRGPAAV